MRRECDRNSLSSISAGLRAYKYESRHMDCVIHRTIIIRFGLIIRFRFRDLIFSPHDTDDIVQPEDDLEDTSANRPQSKTTIRRNCKDAIWKREMALVKVQQERQE